MPWPPADARLLLQLAHAGIESVGGERIAADALRHRRERQAIVALGKAGGALAAGAEQALSGRIDRGFLAVPHGYQWPAQPDGPPWTLHAGGHPLPDQASLAAGRALREWLEALPSGLPLRILMSGGSSACIEDLADGVTLERLRDETKAWLAAGLDIHAINQRRAALSRLKQGGALAFCGDRPVEVLVMSDVPDDDPAVVGSGPFVMSRREGAAPTLSRRDTTIIATNRMALYAIVDRAAALGLPVSEIGVLAGDAVAQGETIAASLLDAAPGVYLWGGECTVQLPDAPGRGGRCQALALAAARHIAGNDRVRLLALASDGVDGNSDDAGAEVDGDTIGKLADEGIDADDALARADAGPALEAAGALVHTGPTGTNVMDLVLAHVSDAK